MDSLVSVEYYGNDFVMDPVAEDDKETRLAVRAKIDAFEKRLQDFAGSEKGDMDEVNDNGLNEYFVDGVYVRELFIPAGVAIVSRLWNRERFWIIAAGDVTFTTEAGIQRVKGPHRQVAPFGSKVALYANEDTLWFAIAASEAKDSDEAEKDLVAEDYSDLRYPWDKLENRS